jgi:predicted dehydrogenase
MEAVLASGAADVCAVSDPDPTAREAAQSLAQSATFCDSFEELLARDLDGIVIATPSALHAAQATRALERGFHVFCQKPLGRSEAEVAAVVAAAKAGNRRLGVDLCYRRTSGLRALRGLLERHELGHVYGVDLVFHNAYGPDKPWFYDRTLSGGGCVVDLGVHLLDAALFLLGFPDARVLSSQLFTKGRALSLQSAEVEDYAVAQLELGAGCAATLACSWGLPAGQDAVIAVTLYGTRGGASFHNVNGSFYDFVLERHDGTRRLELVSPPDAWGGRAIVDFANALGDSAGFDATNEELVRVARLVDSVYATAPKSSRSTSNGAAPRSSVPGSALG